MANRKKIPSYLALYHSGELQNRRDQLLAKLEECSLCPRNCMLNRIAGEKGFCKTARKAVVASYNAHFGEETPLVGASGSGTIFSATATSAVFSVRITRSAMMVKELKWTAANLPPL